VIITARRFVGAGWIVGDSDIGQFPMTVEKRRYRTELVRTAPPQTSLRDEVWKRHFTTSEGSRPRADYFRMVRHPF
jgi:hypothetical protein